MQNSVDGGGKNIALDAKTQEDGTMLVTCDDDGRGMDEDTIVNKFLVLGGTTKIGAGGAAGGFGKAKELRLLDFLAVHSRIRSSRALGSITRSRGDRCVRGHGSTS